MEIIRASLAESSAFFDGVRSAGLSPVDRFVSARLQIALLGVRCKTSPFDFLRRHSYEAPYSGQH